MEEKTQFILEAHMKIELLQQGQGQQQPAVYNTLPIDDVTCDVMASKEQLPLPANCEGLCFKNQQTFQIGKQFN